MEAWTRMERSGKIQQEGCEIRRAQIGTRDDEEGAVKDDPQISGLYNQVDDVSSLEVGNTIEEL